MKITSTIHSTVHKSENKPVPKFPMVMIWSRNGDEIFILATGMSEWGFYKGVCLKDNTLDIGLYSDEWSPTFQPFYGEITIRSEKD